MLSLFFNPFYNYTCQMKRFPKFLKVEMQVPCLEEQNSKKGVTLWHFNTKKMLIHAVTNYIVTLKQASDLH